MVTIIDPEEKDFKVLVVDDSIHSKEAICSFIKRTCPKFAVVDAPKDFFNDFGRAEDTIINGQYDYILFKNDLTKWEKHPVFGYFGENMISFIKEKSPSTTIIALSEDGEEGKNMLKKGAHKFIDRKVVIDDQLRKELPMTFED